MSRNEKKPQSNENVEAQLRALYSPGKLRLIRESPETLSVGQRLRRERQLRKLSLENMANMLSISPSYLGALERGDRPLTKNTLARFHDRLNLSYDYILEGRPVTGTMITQYVREAPSYNTHHNLDVLLNVCNPSELEACYHLVHTFLSDLRRNTTQFQ